MSKQKLDAPLVKFNPNLAPKCVYQTGDVGIEVELEGSVGDCQRQTTRLWMAKGDGSLRGGAEYILSRPQHLSNMDLIKKTFTESLKGYEPKTSIRTSMHVHVCVATNTYREVYQAALLYYMFEELLVRSQPKERVGNLFCLRMSDSRAIAGDIRTSIKEGKLFNFFRQDNHKYAAQNLAAVCKYGSLEYRFMQASYDVRDIEKWTTVLSELVTKGVNTPLDRMFQLYEDLTASEFILYFMPSGSWLINNKTRYDLNELIHTNYDAVKEIQRMLDKHDRFSLPMALWDEDISPGEVEEIIEGIRSRNRNELFVMNTHIDLIDLNDLAVPTPDIVEEGPMPEPLDDIETDILEEDDPNW